MNDAAANWHGRRVLVTGCSGFLGGWLVRGLVARGADVVGLVRNSDRDSDFFRDKLYQHVHVVRGRADDAARMRTLLAVYEIETLFALAADENGHAEPLARAAVTAAGGKCRVVVPVKPGVAVAVISGAAPVTFCKVPTLFGAGERRTDRWNARVFAAAAAGTPIPAPSDPSEAILAAADAADGLLEVAATGTDYFSTLAPQGTAGELYDRLAQSSPRPRLRVSRSAVDAVPAKRDLAAAVSETLAWYAAAKLPVAVPAAVPLPRAA